MIDRNLRALHPITVTGIVIKDENDTLIVKASYENISQKVGISSNYQPVLLAFDIEVEERQISYKELFGNYCTEAFCTGTAAVITPIGSISIENKTKVFNNRKSGEITNKLYNLLTGIQRLEIEDHFGWIFKVE